MKSVLISIKPNWCELIASGKKTIEVRKTRPKIKTPFKCYIYCTQGEPAIYVNGNEYVTDVVHTLSPKARDGFERASGFTKMNGKVIGEFVCDYIMRHCNMQNADLAEQQGMIKRELLFKYSKGKELFGWHISDLKIYDEPKELSEFEIKKDCGGYMKIHKLTRPPQSWGYVEELE